MPDDSKNSKDNTLLYAILIGGGVVVALYLTKKATDTIGDNITPSPISDVLKSAITPFTKGGMIQSILEGVADSGEQIYTSIGQHIPGVGTSIDESKRSAEIGIGTRGDYEECNVDSNCKGGNFLGATSRCLEGRCTPLVQEDTALGVLWNPKEKGIKKYCDKYYLLGDAGSCDSDTQCSNTGLTTPVGGNARFSTAGSKYYCNNLGKCDSKVGPDWLGIYWKKQDIPHPEKLPDNYNKKNENKIAVESIVKNMDKKCRGDLIKDNPDGWNLFAR